MTGTDNLIIFDTTLRDGEQSPGASMDIQEKIQWCRENDQEIINILEKINDDQSRIIANAERKILKILEGDCDTAVGVYAKIDKDLVNIKAELFSVDGKQRFFVEESENKKMVKDLSIKIGEKLKSESKGSYKR